MKDSSHNNPVPEPRENENHKSKSTLGRVLAWSGGIIGGIILLAVILLAGATIYLTPANLTRIVNTRLSEYLNADVEAHNIRFTLWSTFPHFYLELDSASVVSRNFKNISKEQRDSLPDNADFLASVGHTRGSVNLLRLLAGKIVLRDVVADRLRVSLVELNDSLNNYSILPPDTTKTRIPAISANIVRLSHPQPFSFFSAASDVAVHALLSRMELRERKHEKNSYDMMIKGTVSASEQDLEILSRFPFVLGGRVALDFNPLKVRFSDYDISLANIKGHLSMNMDMADNVNISSFAYTTDAFNIMELLRWVPQRWLPSMNGIYADLPLIASARLTAPYSPATSPLPSMEVDFKVPGGSIEYRLADGKKYSVNSIGLDALLNFNGTEPDRSYLDVTRLSAAGEGLDLNATARVTDLFGNPFIEGNADCSTDLTSLAALIPSSSGIRIKGKLDADSRFAFTVAELQDGDFSRLNATASTTISDFSIYDPASGMTVSGKKLSADIDRDKNASSGAVENVSADIKASALSIKAPSTATTIGTLALTASMPEKDLASLLSSAPGAKAKLPPLSAKLSASSLKADMKGTKISSPSVKVSFSGKPSVAPRATHAMTPTSKVPESIPHTPEYLIVNLGKRVKDFLDSYLFRLDISSPAGSFYSKAFPADNRYSGIDLTLTPDSVALRDMRIASRSSAMSMKGSVSNLREFLTSSVPAPLNVNLNVALDTVNLNQIAGTYARGVYLTTGHWPKHEPMPDTLSASDTTAMLVPRNLNAHIKASAKEIVYTNLHLYDLSTALDVAGGDARISNLKIGSDFGHAYLDLAYSSSDIENLGMDLSMGLEQIDVVRFFQRFHTLLVMMPQMKNLSGFVSAEATGHISYFPDMFINIPALQAVVDVQGQDLKVHQDKFIRHITRMMMIHTDDDIHIKDMNVRASIHDNLLELYPFDFDFDRYSLTMVGLNNFNGSMYYHIGITRSPLHFPFGINIKGQFSHPEFRFGGAHYSPDKSKYITSEVATKTRMNMMREMKYYMKEMVGKAVEADTIAN